MRECSRALRSRSGAPSDTASWHRYSGRPSRSFRRAGNRGRVFGILNSAPALRVGCGGLREDWIAVARAVSTSFKYHPRDLRIGSLPVRLYSRVANPET